VGPYGEIVDRARAVSLPLMVRKLATEDIVGWGELLDFVRPRHHWVLVTIRTDGRPQTSPVTGGVSPAGQLMVSTYPERDKVVNLQRDPRVSVCVLSDHFGGAWVQVDGQAVITYAPEAIDDMVNYYRSVSGEHPDWDEFRTAMARQAKCLITIDIERWGPIATGGFPPSLASIDALSELLARDEDDDEGIDDESYRANDEE
jgi:PPOX class probable F420-dependent enzyme